MDDRILKYIWLSNTLRPGSKTPKLLLDYFGTIENIYASGSGEYAKAGIATSECKALSNKDLTLSKTHYNYCVKEHIGFLCYEDSYYPERLKITDNPPPLFYYRGKLLLIDDYPCFAMVGTRECSPNGFRLAYKTAYNASARGAVIVNGLADGIDAACIAAALDANGYAIGVLGCGIDRIYPSKNKQLFYRLSASGLILTEFAPFTEPKGTNFPVRNRVISGLSLATAIFEANAEKSGAMITAKHALEQGRRIFAVPAKPYDISYSGPLELIKNGASVLTEADDILSEYALMFPHRINTRHIPSMPQEKLEEYVAKRFKKSTPSANTSVPQTEQNVIENKNTKKLSPDKVSRQTDKSQKVVKPDKSDTSVTPVQSLATEQLKNIDTSLLSETEKVVFELFLDGKEHSPDDIAHSGIKIQDVLSSVTLLEVYGFIRAVPGGRYKILVNQ